MSKRYKFCDRLKDMLIKQLDFQVSDEGFPSGGNKLSNKSITLDIWDVNDLFPTFPNGLIKFFVSDVSTYIIQNF